MPPAPRFEVQVDPAVHAKHPDYVALVLLASGLVNGPSDARSDARLAAAEADLRDSDELSAELLDRWPGCRLERFERAGP